MEHARSESGARLPARRLSRRQALLQTGAGAAAAIAATAAGAAGLAAQEATPEASPEAMPTVQGDVTPERAAMAVDRIRAYAPKLLEKTGVPGMAVAVIYNDEVLMAEGFGVRELGQDTPIDADTVFQLASVSKSIAATVVSSVVGDGTVTWQSKLADIDPGFALADAWTTQNVTLADLFSHRSGLPDHAGDYLEDIGLSQAEILHRLRYLPAAYSFRAGYLYTNFGLTTAAVAAAAAAGLPWEDLSRQRIYDPLGMSHTSSTFAEYMARENRAIPHVRGADGAWQITPQQRDPDPESPAGGVSSTANDMAKWIRMVLGAGTFEGQEVVPAAALVPVHTPQSVSNVASDPANQRSSFYGLGTNVSYNDFGAPQWSHSGAFALGAGTAYYMLPASNFGIVALTNAIPIGVAETLCLDALDIAQLGEVTRDWLALLHPIFTALMAPMYGTGTDWASPPATVTPALDLSAYTGDYDNPYFGPITVVETDAGLTVQIGPTARDFPLTHYDRDTFFWQPPGENGSVPSGLTFTIGPDGTAIGIDDEYFTSSSAGPVTRATAGSGH